MEYYSGIRKNEILPFVEIRMDLEIIILNEICQSKTNIIWYHLYMESNKNDTNEVIYKTERKTHRHWKQSYGYQRGDVGGEALIRS